MAKIEIVQYPSELLKRKALYIKDVQDPEVQQLASDMLETLADSGQNCAALASTQLAAEKPYAIIVLNPLGEEYEQLFGKGPRAFLNPKLSQLNGRELGVEGCMSVAPDKVYAKVWRATELVLDAKTVTGETIHCRATGFLARCLQHECDHLKGVIYLDHLEHKERAAIDRQINLLRKQSELETPKP